VNPTTGLKLLLYVDDILCRGSVDETEKFYKALSERFDTKDPEYMELSLDRVTPENKLGFIGFDISCRKDDVTGGMVYSID